MSFSSIGRTPSSSNLTAPDHPLPVETPAEQGGLPEGNVNDPLNPNPLNHLQLREHLHRLPATLSDHSRIPRFALRLLGHQVLWGQERLGAERKRAIRLCIHSWLNVALVAAHHLLSPKHEPSMEMQIAAAILSPSTFCLYQAKSLLIEGSKRLLLAAHLVWKVSISHFSSLVLPTAMLCVSALLIYNCHRFHNLSLGGLCAPDSWGLRQLLPLARHFRQAEEGAVVEAVPSPENYRDFIERLPAPQLRAHLIAAHDEVQAQLYDPTRQARIIAELSPNPAIQRARLRLVGEEESSIAAVDEEHPEYRVFQEWRCLQQRLEHASQEERSNLQQLAAHYESLYQSLLVRTALSQIGRTHPEQLPSAREEAALLLEMDVEKVRLNQKPGGIWVVNTVNAPLYYRRVRNEGIAIEVSDSDLRQNYLVERGAQRQFSLGYRSAEHNYHAPCIDNSTYSQLLDDKIWQSLYNVETDTNSLRWAIPELAAIDGSFADFFDPDPRPIRYPLGPTERANIRELISCAYNDSRSGQAQDLPLQLRQASLKQALQILGDGENSLTLKLCEPANYRQQGPLSLTTYDLIDDAQRQIYTTSRQAAIASARLTEKQRESRWKSWRLALPIRSNHETHRYHESMTMLLGDILPEGGTLILSGEASSANTLPTKHFGPVQRFCLPDISETITLTINPQKQTLTIRQGDLKPKTIDLRKACSNTSINLGPKIPVSLTLTPPYQLRAPITLQSPAGTRYDLTELFPENHSVPGALVDNADKSHFRITIRPTSINYLVSWDNGESWEGLRANQRIQKVRYPTKGNGNLHTAIRIVDDADADKPWPGSSSDPTPPTLISEWRVLPG